MNQDQFEREGNFSLAMAIIRSLKKKGLLTAAEVDKIRTSLIERFNPIWGHLPRISALSNQP